MSRPAAEVATDLVVVLESRQRPADPDREQAMRGNSEYSGKMLVASLERLEQLVSRGSES